MQRNAFLTVIAFLTVVALAATLPSWAHSQIISAQPARGFNAPPVYSAAYQPASSYSPGLIAVAQGPEANTIRGWYRDYLGRDPGQDVTALASLLRGGMSPTDLQATIL